MPLGGCDAPQASATDVAVNRIEQWLRDVSMTDNGVVAVAARIMELQKSLAQFDAATDLIVQMNDMADVIDTIPDVSIFDVADADGNVLEAQVIEDKYIDYYLTN